MPLAIRSGTELQHASSALRDASMAGQNLASGSAGRGFEDFKNDYLSWVNDAAVRLQNVFDDPATWEGLHSEYFWRIRDLRYSSPRWAEMINDEARRQAKRIEALREQLDALDRWIGAGAEQIAILDTHVLLHFEPPEQVNWVEVVGAQEVRIVLPLRVVEELDEKKYTARHELAQRARGVLSRLRADLTSSDGAAAGLRDGVTIEVFLDDGPRRKTIDADQEILEVASSLVAIGATVKLVTDDAAMDIRARDIGLSVTPMPLKYLRQKSPK